MFELPVKSTSMPNLTRRVNDCMGEILCPTQAARKDATVTSTPAAPDLPTFAGSGEPRTAVMASKLCQLSKT